MVDEIEAEARMLVIKTTDCGGLSDEELVYRLHWLVRRERRLLSVLLVHLIELDRRRLYSELGCRSLYIYCTQALGYSEHAAYKRMTAARAVARFPMILDLLRGGMIHLAAITMLAPHLTEVNHRELLIRACGRSKRELESMLAEFEPGRRIPDRIWHIPGPTDAAASGQEAPPALPLSPEPPTVHGPTEGEPEASAFPTSPPDASPTMIAIRAGPADGPAPHQKEETQAHPAGEDPAPAPEGGRESPPAGPAATPAARAYPPPEPQVRISFSASEGFFRKLEKARGLLRHKHPSGKLEEVFDETLEAFLDQKDPDRRLAAKERRKAAGRRKEAPVSDESMASGTAGVPEAAGGSEAAEASGTADAQTARCGRRIPQRVKDEVWRRDSGRCAFIGRNGLRCAERADLEFDHIRPWALGGRSDDPKNIRLLCRAHNQDRARRMFGARGPSVPQPDEPSGA